VKFPAHDLEQLRALLSPGRRILATAHIRPDPDAIGSVLAVREFLLQLGCEPCVVLEDPCPDRCRFLPGAQEIKLFEHAASLDPFDAVVIVDSGDRRRIGQVKELIAENATVVNIDHHGSNDRFGTLNFVYPETSACGELLNFLIRELGGEITPPIAANLYAGILTDTGRFRHANTSAQALRTAAELIDAGADASDITDHLYFTVSAVDVRAMGTILSSIELHGAGKVSMVLVALAHGVGDPDHVVDFARAIEGVEIAAMLSEMEDGKIRVSLRSKAFADVSQIAQGFGGGGHVRAAGFRMRGSLQSVRERVLPTLIEAAQTPVKDSE
jgi:phosphoesterase RecJ-like protein